MQKEINYVSISDVIENKIPYHIEKEAYPYTVDFRPRHMDVINHVKVAVGSFKEGYFGLLDSSNNILGCFFDYPNPELLASYRCSIQIHKHSLDFTVSVHRMKRIVRTIAKS